jgi:hypothetical protein
MALGEGGPSNGFISADWLDGLGGSEFSLILLGVTAY